MNQRTSLKKHSQTSCRTCKRTLQPIVWNIWGLVISIFVARIGRDINIGGRGEAAINMFSNTITCHCSPVLYIQILKEEKERNSFKLYFLS